MALTLSCAFATSLDTPEHTRIAESLGYQRAWFYDSAPLYPDVWVQLCRAADRTEQIGLATGVLVPNLRHPMTNAAGIATLVDAAGVERVTIGIGSGFTACLTMGRRPLKWTFVDHYISTLRALLRGEEVEWEGGMIQMMHWAGYGAPRPIEVPFVIAAAGPKGIACAKSHSAGVLGAFEAIPGFDWSVVLTMGTVLDDGEAASSNRAVDAAGHAGAVLLHYMHEHRMLDQIDGAQAWLDSYAAVPEKIRHIAMHDGHLVGLNERDRPYVTGDFLASNGLAMDQGAWRERLAAMAEGGATEIAYQPAGPDIPRELEAFAAMFQA